VTVALAFIIEDDEVIARIFEAALREAQYQTEIISDGMAAVSRIKNSTPDLVILDLHLPKVAGVSVLKSIRSDNRLANTKVIVVSADATLTEYLRNTADLVLVKPVGFNQLRELAIRLKPPSA
jgi:two-component system response regulator AdeR